MGPIQGTKSRSRAPKSSERISALVSSLFTRAESALWDVGCDHGLVGLHAFLSHKCGGLHLVDPVLANPQAAWAKHYQRHFPIEHRSALHLHPSRAQGLSTIPVAGDQVVIAGMGAREMQGIIEFFMQKGVRPQDLVWVLSCQSEKEKMRRFLCDIDLCIGSEISINDRSRSFEIWRIGE